MVVAEVEEVRDQPPVTVMPECLDEQSHREVSCNACSTVTTAPVIKCTVIDQIHCCILDTAAVITVIPRTRDLPVARLRLKGVTSHKANLYGPALTKFTIAGKEFTHMTYEADIKEHLIGIDFLHKYDAVLKIKDEIMNIGQGANRVQIPFTLNESQGARTYVAGKVVYRIRAENSFVLKPFTEKEVKTEFKTDTVADELVRERTNDLPNGNKTRVQGLGGNSLSQGRRRAEAKTAERGGLLNLEEDTMGNQNKNQSQLPGDAKLGLFVSNTAFGNKVSKLPVGVVAQSGLAPCVTAPLTIVMQNFGDKCVTIPKNAVVGEVFVLLPDEYEEGVGEEERDGEKDECAFVNVNNHETVTFEDAEYNTEPSLPEIGEDEDLPKDLQELVSRCTILSVTEKKDLEKLLKNHHDVFAKDNTTFGKCPWIKRTMQDIHETVAHMSKKAAKRMKEYYDRTASLAPFKEGDKVYLYYPRRKKGISTKLLTRWEGHSVILNILNDCNASIKNLENNKVVIVHIDRLAKFPEGDENKHTDLTSAWLSYAT
ncbi:Toxin RelE4 [Frankliniella fusca]|uniref:Toxin RelE4 n=1 Tax=Frankliniella fusca TaxID=407009 RepID=A0AAE1GU14_9NEOP|nr:Toxin RelE4 [Frankliniella fusca]